MTAMPNFFCTQVSRNAAEDPIANADNFQYVLIECPPPWTKEAFDSQSIPSNLKTLYTQVKSTDD